MHTPGKPLSGIARIAAQATVEPGGHLVSYQRMAARSILNRVTSSIYGFEWSINPYRGCEFGCTYCYARYTHAFMERDVHAFENEIYLKDRAGELLWRDLMANQVAGNHIAIGTATDPYQPAESQFGVTRAILETLTAYFQHYPHSGAKVSITTKSHMVVRDLDLLQRLGDHVPIVVNLTITTLNRQLARMLEPRATRPDLRVATVKRLAESGIPTHVFVAPILPLINDDPQDLDALVRAAAEAGAQSVIGIPLRLMSGTREIFFPFLERRFPHLVERYRRWYAGKGSAPVDFRKRISVQMRRLCLRHGLTGAPVMGERPMVIVPDESQLAQLELSI